MTATLIVSGKYRKLPSLSCTVSANDYDDGKQGRCARLTGHTLVVSGDHIKCAACGATWRDEGF